MQPTAPGVYWFYGQYTHWSIKNNHSPELVLVSVHSSKPLPVYLIVGRGESRGTDRFKGVWQEADLPSPPEGEFRGIYANPN